MSQSTTIVNKILAELGSRKGFDWWWDELDEEIKQEIREALMEIVDHELG